MIHFRKRMLVEGFTLSSSSLRMIFISIELEIGLFNQVFEI